IDLVGIVRDAVDLQQVDAPFGILLQQRVIPGLSGGIVFHAPVGRVPWTRIGGIRRIGDREAAVRDGQVALDRGARYAADDVYAELQPLRVNPVAKGLETRLADGGGQLRRLRSGRGRGHDLIGSHRT